MTLRRYRGGVFYLCAAMLLLGCSKEEFNDLVDKTKQSVTDGADKVKQGVADGVGKVQDTAKEQLNMAGSAQLTLDVPVTTTACYASFVSQGGGRPGVLQLRSNKDASQITYPAMFVQAQVKAGGLSELIGQVVSAQIFVQKDQSSPIWFCAPGTHVELKVVSADDKNLSAEIVSGSVRNTQAAGEQNVAGKLNAVLQPQ